MDTHFLISAAQSVHYRLPVHQVLFNLCISVTLTRKMGTRTMATQKVRACLSLFLNITVDFNVPTLNVFQLSFPKEECFMTTHFLPMTSTSPALLEIQVPSGYSLKYWVTPFPSPIPSVTMSLRIASSQGMCSPKLFDKWQQPLSGHCHPLVCPCLHLKVDRWVCACQHLQKGSFYIH